MFTAIGLKLVIKRVIEKEGEMRFLKQKYLFLRG